jgi:hypothetical protein
LRKDCSRGRESSAVCSGTAGAADAPSSEHHLHLPRHLLPAQPSSASDARLCWIERRPVLRRRRPCVGSQDLPELIAAHPPSTRRCLNQKRTTSSAPRFFFPPYLLACHRYSQGFTAHALDNVTNPTTDVAFAHACTLRSLSLSLSSSLGCTVDCLSCPCAIPEI